MKLRRLDIHGYRSLRDVSWEPGDLNVVIGPNGSGKSNLLKVLDLLSASARGELEKYVRREGGMEPLAWDGSTPEISFRLGLSAGEDSEVDLEYHLRLARIGSSSAFRIENELLGRNGSTDGDLLQRSPQRAAVLDEQSLWHVLPHSRLRDDETLLSLAGGFVAPELGSAAVCKESLASWRVFHDFRPRAVSQSTQARMETSVESDGRNLVSVLHTLYTGSRAFKTDLNAALQVAFGDDFEELTFPPAADQHIQMRVRWRSLEREQTAADLSDGMLRLLFLITVLANPDPPPLIALDEPETGLHPSMIPIVAEYAVDAAARTQVILTTHSADLLDAFGDAPPTTTVADWEEGRTRLRVVSDHSLRYWLRQYTLGKLYRSGELEDME